MSEILNFTKMHVLGNDFMIVSVLENPHTLTRKQIVSLADRNRGVGFDQLLLVDISDDPDMDFWYRIFNADGSEVSNCGNGALCIIQFIYHKKLSGYKKIRVNTLNNVMELNYIGFCDSMVDMGKPNFNIQDVPFKANSFQIIYPLIVDNEEIMVTVLSLGNPHCVIVLDDINNADVATIGYKISNHKRFPEQVNVSFMEVINEKCIKLRVFERAVNYETHACGSAACASVVAGNLRGLLGNSVRVIFKSGTLEVNYNGRGQSVQLTGKSNFVFDGRLKVEDFS